MKNYTENYLKVVIKYYKPNNTYLFDNLIKPIKYVRGEYMISKELEQNLIRKLGADAYILYKYFYETAKTNSSIVPTDDKTIGEQYGWSASKVTRLKSKLKNAGYLLIIKETTTKGTTLYKVLLNPSIIKNYLDSGYLPDELIKKTKIDVTSDLEQKLEKTTTNNFNITDIATYTISEEDMYIK